MKIVYDEVTKVFGIHTDRVNGLRLDPRIAKRKNYDEDKLADISEINQLRRSGIIPDTNTPDRVLKIKKYENNKKTGWGRLKNRFNKIKDKAGEYINSIPEKLRSGFPSLRDRLNHEKALLLFKWDRLRNSHLLNNSAKDRDKKVKDNLTKFAENNGRVVFIDDNDDEHAVGNSVTIRNDSSPAILGHELGHLNNSERGESRHRSFDSPETLMDNRGLVLHKTLDQLREEDNANRDAVMNAWVHGGADVKDLDRYFKTAKRAQATYNAFHMLHETPPNIDYRMDPELREKIKEQINEKDYVNKPYKKIGHKDLTREERSMHYPDDKWWWYK